MNNELFNRIKEFTINQSAVDQNDIKENTLLETDLGIYGAEAMDYIIAFGKHFNVNVSNFMAANYFSDEGGIKLFPWIIKLFGMKRIPRKKELTLNHLMKAVEAGRLDEEVINSSL
jgi:acyl carrier protein